MNNTNFNYIDPSREVKYPSKEDLLGPPSGMLCVCGGNLHKSSIPCPDGKPGCCVVHYGYICSKCGKIYK